MVTSSVHTEMMRYLGADKNVGRALRRVGATEDANEVVVCIVDGSKTDVDSARQLVDGNEQEDVGEAIAAASARERIVSEYQLAEDELKVSSLRDALLTQAALSLI